MVAVENLVDVIKIGNLVNSKVTQISQCRDSGLSSTDLAYGNSVAFNVQWEHVNIFHCDLTFKYVIDGNFY